MEVLDSGTLCSAVNNSAFLSNHLWAATSSGLAYAKRWDFTKQWTPSIKNQTQFCFRKTAS